MSFSHVLLFLLPTLFLPLDYLETLDQHSYFQEQQKPVHTRWEEKQLRRPCARFDMKIRTTQRAAKHLTQYVLYILFLLVYGPHFSLFLLEKASRGKKVHELLLLWSAHKEEDTAQ